MYANYSRKLKEIELSEGQTKYFHINKGPRQNVNNHSTFRKTREKNITCIKYFYYNVTEINAEF